MSSIKLLSDKMQERIADFGWYELTDIQEKTCPEREFIPLYCPGEYGMDLGGKRKENSPFTDFCQSEISSVCRSEKSQSANNRG